MIELECLLIQIFPEGGTRGEPFTLVEITDMLGEVYGRVSYSRVYAAFAALSDNPHTAAMVRPLPDPTAEGKRVHLFSALATRRIARRVVKGRLPVKLQQYERQTQHKGQNKIGEAKRKLNTSRSQNALAEPRVKLQAV